jgi:hypothetical protein
MFRWRKKPKLTRRQALSALPFRNPLVTAENLENGEKAITIPRRNDPLARILGLIFAVPKQRRIILDVVGADIWEECDGSHTVADIIAEVAEKYRLDRKEAEVSVTAYMRQLGKRALIAFAVPKPSKEGGAHEQGNSQ